MKSITIIALVLAQFVFGKEPLSLDPVKFPWRAAGTNSASGKCTTNNIYTYGSKTGSGVACAGMVDTNQGPQNSITNSCNAIRNSKFSSEILRKQANRNYFWCLSVNGFPSPNYNFVS